MLLVRRFCVLLALVLSTASVHAADFFFKDGDVIVMMGDSITEQHLYSNYVEMWTVTRFPKWKLTFRNVGIGGDRSVGGNTRFARDVVSYKPTALTVDFGMNDGGYKVFQDATFKPYMEGLQGIADQAKTAGIRVAWVTPQPLDKDDQGPTALSDFYNQTLEKFSAGVKTTADNNAGLFVDQFHPYLKVLDHARGSNAKYERITAGDAVHPGPPGQALMAASILQGLSFPSLVSSVEIDAKAKKVMSTANCVTEAAEFTDAGIKFTRQDGALPFFPSEASSILKWTPILEDLNDYRLKVSGLSAGTYDVKVDGTTVATLSADELAKGVNLASAVLGKGPIADQVGKVKDAIEAKNKYHHDSIFRGVVLSNAPQWVNDVVPDLDTKKQALIKSRLEKLPAMDAAVAEAVAIKPHVFEIVLNKVVAAK